VFLINQHRVDTVEDARAYIARLKDVKRVMAEVSVALKARAGRRHPSLPAFTFAPVEADTRKVITGAPFAGKGECALWTDFRKKVGALTTTDVEQADLLLQGAAALTGPFREGYEQFLATQAEIAKGATTNNGAWALPDGAAYYANRLKVSTTTSLTADEIHQIGLDELARIQGEMRQIMTQGRLHRLAAGLLRRAEDQSDIPVPQHAGGQGGLSEGRHRPDRPGDGRGRPSGSCDLPKAPLEVRSVEPWREATASIAFYNRPRRTGNGRASTM
jgi:uncharacterized protein (DUF885 family)